MQHTITLLSIIFSSAREIIATFFFSSSCSDTRRHAHTHTHTRHETLHFALDDATKSQQNIFKKNNQN